ncbi:MAG: ABC transporter permease subunit [Propionibacteriaceae bacterium]|nr:ABC transporter permease subunit [Propionibacteriaceae bacterium]
MTAVASPAARAPESTIDRPGAEPATTSWIQRFHESHLRRVGPSVLVILPFLALFAIFLFWPIASMLMRSLNADGLASFDNFTLQNYAQILTDDLLLKIELRTLRLALFTTVLTMAIGFPMAYLLSRMKPKIAVMLLLLVLIPYFVPTVVRLFSLTVTLSPFGLINSITQALGWGKFDLLFNTQATLLGMVVYQLPMMTLLLYSGLSRIDTNLMVAARTLGARPSKAFFTIYLPLAWPVMLSSMLLIFVLSLSFFLVPSILGGGDNATMSVFIRQRVEYFQWGQAATMGIVLLFTTLTGYILSMRLGGGASVSLAGAISTKGITDREKLHGTPATWLCAFMSIIGLILLLVPVLLVFPLAFGKSPRVIFPPRGFTWDWFASVLTTNDWIPPLLKSLGTGFAVALLAVGIALSVARFLQRITKPAIRSLVLGLVFAPMVTPGILLAIGLYDVQAQLGLLGHGIGLILAHTVIALPLCFAVINSALAGSDVNLEHAAWTLGASRVRTFWDIVVRSKMGSIIGAGVIAFMCSWDDVIIALFQTGLQKTLPVTIYRYLETGVVPQVPAISSLLVLMVLAGMAIWLIFTRRAERRAKPVAASTSTPAQERN